MTLQDQLYKLSGVDRRKIDELFNLLSMDAADMTSAQLRAAREAAGLSLVQAAKLIGMYDTTLRCFEQDQELLTDMKEMPADRTRMAEMFRGMNRVYGLKTPLTGKE
jgi:DNA-binding transcriptional regulator YiaG